jgi:hypothetical protein
MAVAAKRMPFKYKLGELREKASTVGRRARGFAGLRARGAVRGWPERSGIRFKAGCVGHDAPPFVRRRVLPRNSRAQCMQTSARSSTLTPRLRCQPGKSLPTGAPRLP